MIGEDLDKHVRDHMRYLRSMGAVINTAVLIASTEGILTYVCTKILICYQESI